MKLAATYALAQLTKEPVPENVKMAYNDPSLAFGKDYIIPKPLDTRLISRIAPAVAKAPSNRVSRAKRLPTGKHTRINWKKGWDKTNV